MFQCQGPFLPFGDVIASFGPSGLSVTPCDPRGGPVDRVDESESYKSLVASSLASLFVTVDFFVLN